MYAPPAIIDVVNRIRSPFNVSGPALAAGAAAVSDRQFTAAAREFNNHWLAFLTHEITQLGLKVHPSIGNFVLVQFPASRHTASAANAYMTDAGLIPREVTNYGLPDCLRISVGLEADNKAVVKTLSDFLKS
jgi:histidinol-phosphate aminotransferase